MRGLEFHFRAADASGEWMRLAFYCSGYEMTFLHDGGFFGKLMFFKGICKCFVEVVYYLLNVITKIYIEFCTENYRISGPILYIFRPCKTT